MSSLLMCAITGKLRDGHGSLDSSMKALMIMWELMLAQGELRAVDINRGEVIDGEEEQLPVHLD